MLSPSLPPSRAAAAPPYVPRYAENLAAVSEYLAKSSQNAASAKSKSPQHSVAPPQHTQSGNKEGGAKGSRRQESAKAFKVLILLAFLVEKYKY
jgi:hypothetical protein